MSRFLAWSSVSRLTVRLHAPSRCPVSSERSGQGSRKDSGYGGRKEQCGIRCLKAEQSSTLHGGAMGGGPGPWVEELESRSRRQSVGGAFDEAAFSHCFLLLDRIR
jgi:hypothetical protein